jgi:hypothetical protein
MQKQNYLMKVAVMATSILLFILFCNCTGRAADITNCLLCHQYPGLSRIDENGEMKLLFINESIENNSVHATIKCEECHTDIKKIPHEDVKKVDCLAVCHIVEPSSEKKFSHEDVETFLSKSVHSKVDQDGNPKKYPEDYPDCKDCHDNPLYRPLSFFKHVRPGISENAMGRCRVCHKKDDFIFRFYNHITTRMHAIRSPRNLAEVCAKCHDNPDLVKRHELNKAVYTYGQTFHGKAANFLDERIPDCLDCHVNLGQSVHQMLSHKNPESITNDRNKINSCRMVDCHPNASPKLARYDVHPEMDKKKRPSEYYFSVFFLLLTGGTLLPLTGIMLFDLARRLISSYKKESEE